MLTPKQKVYAYRWNRSKQTSPFKVEWSRKLKTKERQMLVNEPYAIFRPRDCAIHYCA